MVQRSGTMVVGQETIIELGLGPLYSEDAIERGGGHESSALPIGAARATAPRT